MQDACPINTIDITSHVLKSVFNSQKITERTGNYLLDPNSTWNVLIHRRASNRDTD